MPFLAEIAWDQFGVGIVGIVTVGGVVMKLGKMFGMPLLKGYVETLSSITATQAQIQKEMSDASTEHTAAMTTMTESMRLSQIESAEAHETLIMQQNEMRQQLERGGFRNGG